MADKVELSIKLRKNILENIFSRLSKKDEKEFDDIVEDALLSYFNVKIEDLLEEYSTGNTTTINNVNLGYYVYIFLDSTIKKKIKIGEFLFPYEPFYVGKGTGDRFKSLNRNERVNERIDKIKKLGGGVIVLKIKEDLTNLQSHRLENFFINKIGRRDLGKGPLLNESSGITFINPEDTLLELTDLNIERNINRMVLDSLNNSRTIDEASKKLGLSGRSLYRRMKDLKIVKKKGKYSFDN